MMSGHIVNELSCAFLPSKKKRNKEELSNSKLMKETEELYEHSLFFYLSLCLLIYLCFLFVYTFLGC